jgi:hypothetical protein
LATKESGNCGRTFPAAGEIQKTAMQFMSDDPAVKNKIMLVKVHPYNIAIK